VTDVTLTHFPDPVVCSSCHCFFCWFVEVVDVDVDAHLLEVVRLELIVMDWVG